MVHRFGFKYAFHVAAKLLDDVSLRHRILRRATQMIDAMSQYRAVPKSETHLATPLRSQLIAFSNHTAHRCGESREATIS